MSETLEFTFDLPVYPERVYRAWLDAGEHSRFTGLPAEIHAVPGTKFSALGGRVTGELRVLSPVGRILQSWTMHDFSPILESEIELALTPTCTGSELQLIQQCIPDGKSGQVLDWWESNYFRPLKSFFEEWVGEYAADMGDG